MDLKSRTLSNFAELVKTGECKKFKGRLKVGVDLGTANTVPVSYTHLTLPTIA